MSSLEILVLIVCVVILMTQSINLFIDAMKNGFNHWMWGILGLIQAPFPLIFYLIVKKIRKREEAELYDYRDYWFRSWKRN
ncbi:MULTISPECIES: sigma-Y antisigma factor component [Peribacillus]|uniref:sigma-Y antisigma factor component n=1 Tax=Peribacillus TaxID=2675229 RepID=UPI00203F8B6A|nr:MULTISPECIES: sigma-Y antisigma factor component [Peribacillus]MCM3674926.1 sigma-Y antisigma factor component [Peribacillus simplex]MDQ0880153.1 amino acid permease [Peribacillus sp. V2I11]